MNAKTYAGLGLLSIIGAIVYVVNGPGQFQNAGPVSYKVVGETFLAVGPANAVDWGRVADPEVQRVLACNGGGCEYAPLSTRELVLEQWQEGELTNRRAYELLAQDDPAPSPVRQITVAPHSPDILLVETVDYGWSLVARTRWDNIVEAQP